MSFVHTATCRSFSSSVVAVSSLLLWLLLFVGCCCCCCCCCCFNCCSRAVACWRNVCARWRACTAWACKKSTMICKDIVLLLLSLLGNDDDVIMTNRFCSLRERERVKRDRIGCSDGWQEDSVGAPNNVRVSKFRRSRKPQKCPSVRLSVWSWAHCEARAPCRSLFVTMMEKDDDSMSTNSLPLPLPLQRISLPNHVVKENTTVSLSPMLDRQQLFLDAFFFLVGNDDKDCTKSSVETASSSSSLLL